MKKTTIYLPDDLLTEVKAASAQERRPEAEIIREALGAYFKGRNRTLPSFVGMISDGSFDAADDEKYLAEHWKPGGDSYEEDNNLFSGGDDRRDQDPRQAGAAQ